jgi:hypothetical protein
MVGRSGAAILAPGGRARLLGDRLHLEAGDLRLESPGEPLVLEAAGARVDLESGILLAEEVRGGDAGAAALLFRQACAADDAAVVLRLLEGVARVRDATGASRDLSADRWVRVRRGVVESSGAVQGPPRWRGDGGWRRLEGFPKRLPEGSHPLGPPSGKVQVWEAVLRRARPSAYAGLLFEAEGKTWLLPVGSPLGTEGEWLRIRATLSGGWVRVQAGGFELLRCPLSTLPGRLDAAEGGFGIRVWGGEVEVREVRWR